MHDHEEAMQVYVQLVAICDQKRQPQVRDRLLLLAGVEACRAGWLEVAESCHRRLVASNPAHQAHRFANFPDALRDSDFQKLVQHWERYCPFEKAEAMLADLEHPITLSPDLTVGEQMLQLLNHRD